MPARELAYLLANQKRAADGEVLLKEVVDLRRANVDGNEIAMAEGLEAYGMYLRNIGEFKRAAPWIKEAVTIFKVNEVFRREPYFRALVAHANRY